MQDHCTTACWCAQPHRHICQANVHPLHTTAGSKLLEKCLLEASQDDNIKEAYLHVQTNNEEAIRFYKLFNFNVGNTVSNYYKRLDPPDAVVLSRMLVPQC